MHTYELSMSTAVYVCAYACMRVHRFCEKRITPTYTYRNMHACIKDNPCVLSKRQIDIHNVFVHIYVYILY